MNLGEIDDRVQTGDGIYRPIRRKSRPENVIHFGDLIDTKEDVQADDWEFVDEDLTIDQHKHIYL